MDRGLYTRVKRRFDPMLKRIIFCILILLYHTSSVFSENTNYFFKHINNKNGLSQNFVHSISQDNEGFLWFATESGLNRYDGYSFRIYSYDPENVDSISNNKVKIVFNDSSGVIWVGTKGGGAYGIYGQAQSPSLP